MHALTDDEYTVWRAAAAGPELLGKPCNRRDTISIAKRAGVRRARPIVNELIRSRLIWEIDVLSDDVVLFTGLHRLEARSQILCRAPGDTEAFTVGVPDAIDAPALPDTANIYLYAPTFDDLWSTCQAVAEVSPTAPHPNWPKEHVLAVAFLAEIGPLITSGAAAVKRARPERGEYA